MLLSVHQILLLYPLKIHLTNLFSDSPFYLKLFSYEADVSLLCHRMYSDEALREWRTKRDGSIKTLALNNDVIGGRDFSD